MASPTEQVLWEFFAGREPFGRLMQGPNGSLIGIANNLWCGSSTINIDCGSVYQLTPPLVAGDFWSETDLHAFHGGTDGSYPSDLIAVAGVYYGTTSQGGGGSCPEGCGTVFTLTPPTVTGGAWQESIIYRFTGASDGYAPITLAPHAGKLYGVSFGGPFGFDNIFELSPPIGPGGTWNIKILYSFTGGTDGGYNSGYLLVKPDGTILGETLLGGVACPSSGPAFGCGTLYALHPPTTVGANWTEQVLYAFGGLGDGFAPTGGLLLRDGTLYGTTEDGGNMQASRGGCGTVFSLTAPVNPNDTWRKQSLHTFSGAPDGCNPTNGLVSGPNGSLFGSTALGGEGNLSTGAEGTVYQVLPPAIPGKPWIEALLYTFQGIYDGTGPDSRITKQDGALYGVTGLGGN